MESTITNVPDLPIPALNVKIHKQLVQQNEKTFNIII